MRFMVIDTGYVQLFLISIYTEIYYIYIYIYIYILKPHEYLRIRYGPIASHFIDSIIMVFLIDGGGEVIKSI